MGCALPTPRAALTRNSLNLITQIIGVKSNVDGLGWIFFVFANPEPLASKDNLWISQAVIFLVHVQMD